MRDSFYQPATPAQIELFASRKGIAVEEAAKVLAASRLERLRVMDATDGDPFVYGYEPPIWIVTLALLRGIRPTQAEALQVKHATGMEWAEFCERIRRVLGFSHPVGEVLIMGANRSGKTDFAAKLALRYAMKGNAAINIGLQTLPTGKQVQMPRVWHYMPAALKKRNVVGKKSDDPEEHIAYSRQNGFASSKITFRNRSGIRFVSYDMDVNDAMEGSALDFCWLDEEFPKSFLEAARGRLASKRGIFIGTFTPISGYTPVVADYLSDVVVTRRHTAYMLPTDGKPADPASELGLTSEEYARLVAWRDAGDGADPCVPESRPENCFKWVLGTPDVAGGVGGRSFATTPRVGVCKGGDAAAVWFYGSDNPYGIPGEVIQMALKNRNALGMIKKRVYGIAEQIKGRMFPEFRRERNVIDPAELPANLVRVMVVDPAPERNWTSGWFGYDPVEDVLYKYRDWPGAYEIPGVGVPGPWAVPSDRRNGVNDGDKGDAQESFGMGFLHYKFEWARLEGWNDYRDWIARGHQELVWPTDWDEIAGWSEVNGVEEPIEYRVIDSRAASQTKTTCFENLSLFDEVSRLAEGFQPASGQKIDVGLNVLRDRIVNGKYRITSDCVNTIFAYETYTGADGQKGACKDFIDCDRYCVLSGVTDYQAEMALSRGARIDPAAVSAPRSPRQGRPRIRAGGR